MYVKFTCTVKGKPLPKIIWYKDMIPIQRMVADAGHIKITSQYGVHTLEIYRLVKNIFEKLSKILNYFYFHKLLMVVELLFRCF